MYSPLLKEGVKMRLKWKYPDNITFPGVRLRPYLVDLIKNNHTLIAGTTGAGKSVLENNIIYNTLLCNAPGESKTGNTAQFIFIDPKKVELRKYKNLPHCIGYADNINDIAAMLRGVRCEVDKRLQTMIKYGLVKSTESPIYIFVDEIVDIVTNNAGKDIIKQIADIISISRATNIFFIICTQAPNRKILKPEIVLNCNCRVALRCNSAIESRQIINSNAAASLPPHGIAIVIKDISQYKIEIPLIDNADIMKIIKFWEKQHPFMTWLRNIK